MNIMDKGMHHSHLRKRIHLKHEPFPHPDKWKRRMDYLIYLVGIIGPIMAFPQAWKIWSERNASGVSLISWVSFFVFSCIWVVYGLMHKEKPIILNYSLWVIFNALVVAGIILFG
ncbi:MAG: hypothetical protein ABIE23_02670 [archaeon]